MIFDSQDILHRFANFFLDLLGLVVADLRLKFRSDSWRFDGVIWIRTFASFSSSFSSCLFMRTGILTEQRAHRSSGCRCASQVAHTPARPSSWCQRAVVRRGTASGGVHLQPEAAALERLLPGWVGAWRTLLKGQAGRPTRGPARGRRRGGASSPGTAQPIWNLCQQAESRQQACSCTRPKQEASSDAAA